MIPGLESEILVSRERPWSQAPVRHSTLDDCRRHVVSWRVSRRPVHTSVWTPAGDICSDTAADLSTPWLEKNGPL